MEKVHFAFPNFHKSLFSSLNSKARNSFFLGPRRSSDRFWEIREELLLSDFCRETKLTFSFQSRCGYASQAPLGLGGFGLNAHRFWDLIGRTVEAYVDDIVVKSKRADSLVADLDQAFKCLRAKNIKLNPEKCIFGIPRGVLLGFIISERGIEANPKKISAITNMGPIQDLKGVQRVTGCLWR
jgi:hypothetical protein